MARSAKPRKAYRPRPVATLLGSTHRRDIEITAYAMIVKLEQGMFDEVDDSTAAYLLNCTAHFGVLNRRQDVVDLAESGMEALESVRARRARIGKYGASGDDLCALRDSLIPLTKYFLSQPQHRIAEVAQWVMKENERMANFKTEGVCDICGKNRGRPYDHTECSKKRKARGGVKETIRPARPARDTIEYLSKK